MAQDNGWLERLKPYLSGGEDVSGATQTVTDGVPSWRQRLSAFTAEKEVRTSVPTESEALRNHASTDITLRNRLRDAEAAEKQAGAAYREVMRSGDEQARKEAGAAVTAANAERRSAQAAYDASKVASYIAQKNAQYASVRENSDFRARSEPDANVMRLGQTGQDAAAALYWQINSRGQTKYKNQPSNYITDEEARTFNYLYNTRSEKDAMAYYDYIERDLNSRRETATLGKYQTLAEEKPAAASALSVGANLISGVGIADEGLQMLENRIQGDPRGVDHASGGMLPGKIAGTIRKTRAKNIADRNQWATVGADENGQGGNNILSTLYQLGMSGVDSLVVAGLSAVGVPAAEVLLGGSAATQAMLDAKERGVSDGKALVTGLAAGTAEVLFEHLSIEKLLDTPKPDSIRQLMKAFATQAGVEGSEEVFTSLANTVTDRLINGGQSEIRTRIAELQAAGEPNAVQKAWTEWAGGIALDFFGGALMGGVMGGSASALNFVTSGDMRVQGQVLRQMNFADGAAQTMISESMRMAKKKQTRDFLAQTANKVLTRETLTDEELGRVYGTYQALQAQRNARTETEHREAEAAEDSLNSGKKLTTGELGGLSWTNQTAENGTVRRRRLNWLMQNETGNYYSEDRGNSSGSTAESEAEGIPNAWDSARETARPGTESAERERETAPLTLPWVNGERETAKAAERIAEGRPTTAEVKALYENQTVVNTLKEKSLLTEQQAESRDAGAMYQALTTYHQEVQQNEENGAAETADTGSREPERSGNRARYGGYPERQNRVAAGGQSLYQLAGAGQRRTEESGGKSLGNVLRAGKLGRISSREAGIANGSRRATLSLIPDRLSDAAEAQLADFRQRQRELAERGVKLIGFTGTLELTDGNGRRFRARGYTSADGRTILVRLDHGALTWRQIAEHEDFHRRVKNDRTLLRDCAREFRDRFTEREQMAILADYAEAYGYAEDDYSPEYIMEEVLADYYAGIDVFAGTEDAQADIRERESAVRETVGNRGARTGADTEGQARTGADTGQRFSRGTDGDEERFREPITAEDIESLRSIGQKSVFDFTEEDFEKAGKWLYKLSQQFTDKTKSPLYRAMYGEWRDKDSTPVKVAEKAEPFEAGKETNLDTGIVISWGNQVKGETKIKYGTESPQYRGLEYIADIVRNAVLLDSNVSAKKSKSKMPNTTMIHSFYSIVKENDGLHVLKLIAEEAASRDYSNHFVRAYELQRIEEAADPLIGVLSKNGGLTKQAAAIHTVADLYAAVKGKKKQTKTKKPNRADSEEKTQRESREIDADYMDAVEAGDMETAQKEVNKAAKRAGYRINAYHGTPINGLTVFDAQKIGSNTDDGIFGSGFYFTTDMNTADSYAGKNGVTMPVKIKADNPFWMNRYHDKAKVAELLGMDASALTMRKSGISTVVTPSGGQERQFTSHLLEAGYDSVVVQHGRENYEIVVFDPAQIKSADTVTYDDNGNVIPLSERFDQKRNDIRFSREVNSQGEALTPQQAEYFRDSKVRDENGNLLVMHHGTSNYGFTVFDANGKGKYGLFGIGNYFTESREVAEAYQEKGRGNSKGTYDVYLNITNPLDMDGNADIEQWKNAFRSADADTDYLDGCRTNTDCYRALEEFCRDEGMYRYEAEEMIQDMIREMGYDGITHIGGLRRGGGEKTHRVYITFEPEQSKSVSNANPTSDPDIRFSRDLPGETEALRKENGELREKLAWWEKQMTLTESPELRRSDTDRLTRSILKKFSSKADKNETERAIKALGDYLIGRDVTWTKAKDMALSAARDILNESSELVNDGQRETYQELKKYLRGQRISFKQKSDIADYESFRRRNFGRFIISEDGTPIESLWEEMQDMFGKGYFPEDITHPTDMMLHMEALLNRMQDVYTNPYSADMAEASELLANEIIDRLLSDEVRQEPPTIADEQERKFAKQLLDAENRTEQVRQLLREEKDRRNQIIKERVQEQAGKRNREFRENYMEQRSRSELRRRILKQSERLTQKVLKPNDKSHVPEALRKPVAAVLAAVNRESGYDLQYGRDGKYHAVVRGSSLFAEPTARTRAFKTVRDELLKVAENTSIDEEVFGDGATPGMIQKVIEDYADIPLPKMNSSQLADVAQVLNAIEGAVNNYNRMVSEARWAFIDDAAADIRKENQNKKAPKEFRKTLGKVQKLTGLDMMTPEAYFHRLGKPGDALFRMLRNAQDDFIRLTDKAAKDTQKIIGETDIQALEKETHEVTVNGQTVTMTTAQLMDLYLLMKRPQALNHIETGGFMVEPVEKGVRILTSTEPIRINRVEDLYEAIKPLTAEQMRIADALQEYLSKDMAEVGNKASMQVYGYKKFGMEDRYWRIRSNRNELASSVEKDTQVTSVANRGFTKATVPNANTSVLVGSVFDSFAGSVMDMNTYGAWLAATEDMKHIQNYNFMDADGVRAGTVKGILNRVFGSGGKKYLQNLMADIAQGTGAQDSGLTNGLVGSYKAAAIGANLRVILQQPTAILRAADMINPKYLAAGLKNPMKAFARAKENAPIAVWKDWGYFDVNTGRQMKDVLFDNSTKMEKAKQAAMSLAGKADSFAWGQLWGAVEAETKAERKDLKPGTKEFNDYVAKRFTEIVDRTQVVDGILQRSQIMRSDNELNKAATSFMAEPTKQYNMLLERVYDARTAGGGEAGKKAKRALARTVAALLISGIANSAAQSIMDATRDDDRERSWWEKWLKTFIGWDAKAETFGEKFKSYMESNVAGMLNPTGYLPYFRDAWSIIQGYDVSRMDMGAISDTVNAARRWVKSLEGENGYTVGYSAMKMAEQAAKLLGIPLYNLERDLTGFVNTFANETDNLRLQYAMTSFVSRTPDSGKPNSDVTSILWNAYLADDGSYEAILNQMKKDGYDGAKVEDALDAKWKKESGYLGALKLADLDRNKSYSEGEKLKAIGTLKLPTLKETEDLMKSQLTSNAWAKYAAVKEQGITLDAYLSVWEILPEYDKDQNGSYRAAEVKAALDSRPGLTYQQKGALWQALTGSSSTKNNPFDREAGQKVIDGREKHKSEAENADRWKLRLPWVE